MTCPFCDAHDVERVGLWGGQMITAQWRCRACGSYFEAVREDFDDAPGSTTPPPSRRARVSTSAGAPPSTPAPRVSTPPG